jgi:aryl-alcohol dehydrogenase-like predicted oxidoreductase
MERFYHRALKTLKIDTADVLLLGWHNKPPSPAILERALKMKEKGMFRFLALSGHHRPLFADLAPDERFGLFHVRYNAAHRGAEDEVFARLPDNQSPGIVTYTATRWGDLLKANKMPKGMPPMTAAECYRFVLSNKNVDVCMTGPKNREQMREALRAFGQGALSSQEMERVGAPYR